MVVHCNDRLWEDIHAEIVGSRGSDVGRCNGAVRDMVHVELHGHCIGYVDEESVRIRTILDGGFDDLECSCNGSDRFCSLYWHLNVTKESRRLIVVFWLDHDVRERTRLGMAERVHNIICSSNIDIGNWGGQQRGFNAFLWFRQAHQARQQPP